MLVKDNSLVSTQEMTLLKQKIENKNLETVYLQQKIAQKNQQIADLQQVIEQYSKSIFFAIKQKIKRLVQRNNPHIENNLVANNLARTQYVTKYPEIVLIKASALFDRDWYLATYPDVIVSGMEPAQHYLQLGAKEGYNPSPNFSTDDYLFLYPDVRHMNPLVHYEIFGRAEGRVCHMTKEISGFESFLLEKKIKIIFISGDPDTPGHIYRVTRYANAAKAMGIEVSEFNIASACENLEEIYSANLLIIWRAIWDEKLSFIFSAARKAKIAIIYDIDDLLIDPALAKVEIVDSIRTTDSSESAAEDFFTLLQASMKQADYCSATTNFLVDYMCSFGKKTLLLPNGFDETTWCNSRLALRARLKRPHDGLIRIGYASGSRTHQKDFAQVANVLVRLLRERADCRLVLFRKGTVECLDIKEYPELLALSQQIEWRELVPLKELPAEMARFDINLAPLEVGNAFCEAKSELKFFESALVEVPVVASPTQTFRAAIEDGKTGFLAYDEESWYISLCKLLDNPLLRKQIGRSAYYSVLWKYGPERRMELLSALLDLIFYPGSRAAHTFELNLLKSKNNCYIMPIIPAHEIIANHDKLNMGEITVVVLNYNTSQTLIERLESVKNQSLFNIDLIIVDDCSTDNSLEVASQWIKLHKNRFNRVMFIKNTITSGYGLSKNVGFANAETLFVMCLNPDNKLLPDFAVNCLAKIKETNAAFVYPNIQTRDGHLHMAEKYNPFLFVNKNFVSEVPLVRLAAWAYVGGYEHFEHGNEDYDFWCKLVEHGLFGYHVNATLGISSLNKESLLNKLKNNPLGIRADIHKRHPWVLSDRLGDK